MAPNAIFDFPPGAGKNLGAKSKSFLGSGSGNKVGNVGPEVGKTGNSGGGDISTDILLFLLPLIVLAILPVILEALGPEVLPEMG